MDECDGSGSGEMDGPDARAAATTDGESESTTRASVRAAAVGARPDGDENSPRNFRSKTRVSELRDALCRQLYRGTALIGAVGQVLSLTDSGGRRRPRRVRWPRTRTLEQSKKLPKQNEG